MPPAPAYPGPAYRIETQRLVIRCYQPADASLLLASLTESLEHLRPWMVWVANEPEELDEKVKKLRRCRARFDMDEDFIYGIFSADETRQLGGTGLHTRIGDEALEIGYWIHADYINQGLATETSAALTRVAFEVNGVSRVEIHCAPENVRSAAVPRKLGYIHEATLKARIHRSQGGLGSSMIWTLFAEDYPNSPAASAQIKAFDALNRRII